MKFPRDGNFGSQRRSSGSPPEEYRYSKGTSGNPHRRPTHQQDLRSALLRELAKPLPKAGGKLAPLPTTLENVARATVIDAAKKDKRALRRIRQLLPPIREAQVESMSDAQQKEIGEKLADLLEVSYSTKGELGYYRGVAADWPEDYWPTINGQRITAAERDYLLERARADPHVQQHSSTFTTPIPGGRHFESGRLLKRLAKPEEKPEDKPS